MREHRIGRPAVLAVALLGALFWHAADPPPAAAQWCRVEVKLENMGRRVRGDVNAECGGPSECVGAHCHDAPWGNWGVKSGYGPLIDGFQFAGWKPKDGWRQWNSCTALFSDPHEHFNDGAGRQRADPDDEQTVGTAVLWFYAGARQHDTCDDHLPEVRIDTFTMELWELDKNDPNDDWVSDLDYRISTPITCSTAWNCYGRSYWYHSRSTDAAKTQAFARITVSSRFSW